jgi:hypothetical protein
MALVPYRPMGPQMSLTSAFAVHLSNLERDFARLSLSLPPVNKSRPLQTLLLRNLLLLLWVSVGVHLHAQIMLSGRITNEAGEALPFATAHLKGTTTGTSANAEGYYHLDLAPGTYEVVFQYIGYRPHSISVRLDQQPVRRDVELMTTFIDMQEVVVLAGEEDPAYPIIRETIRRRKAYRDRLQGYSCQAYIKGGMRVVDVVGGAWGDAMREAMGEDAEGFIYLSESRSNVYFQRPDKRKEVMIASKVSGDARGFSFNQFGIVDFQENTATIGRPLVNPIADNALSHYRYRLLQTWHDSENREMHKIEVIPRRRQEAVFAGVLYILGDSYRIESLDLFATGTNIKIDLIDTLRVRQTYLPQEDDYWLLFQQTLSFQVSLLGVRIGGDFMAVTSNYSVNPEFPPGLFDGTILDVEREANTKEDSYWDQFRPMPLTEDEQKDYVLKDSLALIYESKPWQDSLDRNRNRLRTRHILTGYTYHRTYEGRRYTVQPILPLYNAIQGFWTGVQTAYRQTWREHPGRQLELGTRWIYGFADQQHRYLLTARYQANNTDRRYIQLQAGRYLHNLNDVHIYSTLFDAWLLLSARQGIIRWYDRRHVELSAGKTLTRTLRVDGRVSLEQRGLLSNASNYTFRDLEGVHPSNDDLGRSDFSNYLVNGTIGLAGVDLTWQPGQRYIKYPDRWLAVGSRYPELQIGLRGGIRPGEAVPDFLHVRAGLRKNQQWNTIYGAWSYHLEGGAFSRTPTFFQDFSHFMGAGTGFVLEGDGPGQYRALPIYERSTGQAYLQTFHEWDDNSFLFDKVPVLRKLGWAAMFSAAHLWTAQGQWTELSAGIHKIGWGIFRPLRVHGVVVLENGMYRATYLRVGMLPIRRS